MSLVFGTTLCGEDRDFAEVAARLAARSGSTLRLVHVCEDPRAPVVLGTDEESILGDVRARLETEARRLRDTTGAAVYPHLAAGSVVNALTSIARFEAAELLVVGGSADARRSLLGTTSERVARLANVATLTLRDAGRLLSWLRGERPLKVLVGVDLGRAARAARAFAAGLRRLGPVELAITTVVAPLDAHARLGLPAPRDEHGLSSQAEEVLLRELAESAPADEGEADHRIVAARGGADAHLAAEADRGDFDLVVLGQRRSSLVEQLWYGSVARGVLRAAPIAVACIPPDVPAASASYRPPRVVLAATDFSEPAHAALAQALGTVVDGGRVHLAHVITTPPPTVPDRQSAREHAWYRLSKLAAADADGRSDETPVSVERHVLEGDAVEQLLALGQRVGADLLVVGTHGRSALGGALLGSVAQRICERATVPVLLVPLEPH